MSCEMETPQAGEDGMLLLSNMEIKIVTLVVKGSAKLTVPTD